MNRFHLYTLISLLCLIVSVDVLAREAGNQDLVIVGGDWNYPPYEFLNESGEPDGFNTELTRAIADVMGMDVNVQLSRWDDMRARLSAGQVDALQGMVYSEVRARNFSFSPPHAIINQSIFTRVGEPAVDGISELKGKEVIVQKGGIMHDYLLQNHVNAHLILVDTHAEALRLLASGRHDYALVANLPGLYLGKELELSNIKAVGEPFGAQRYGYAVKKGNEQLLARFSEGLAILKNTGRYQEIYDKWLGPLEAKGPPWKKIGLAAAILSAVMLAILGGTVVWNRMLSREVTRRTQELQLRQQQLIQADKMTSLGVLVSGIAHEINNPSSLLLLNLPVMKDAFEEIEGILEAYYEEHGDFNMGGLSYSRMRNEVPLLLDDMVNGVQRIRRIVDDLRDFARQEPADISEEVDLNQVVATSIRLVNNTISESTDKFEVRYGENLPPFRGNAQRIEQVVINLIVNACHSLESREKGIRITTRFLQSSRRLALLVEDEGMGIEEEHLARLCDPFYTTKREVGGTGLGLSVSDSIVKEHGGVLEFISKPGQGTKVTLTLPAYQGNTVI
ncbi:transporter substrate-binding domain-containing protein [Hahella sp. CCB-MM4]|uniref:transporter substrate-binding domain-containing protein n=1 Tax=Hahella sp. (strain CCB-MM4) TaxID=1926491 RepID=UPI001FEE7297|nr:transporter substrate-binding domain-containing protein [Hahella sp. CCB-MM4]